MDPHLIDLLWEVHRETRRQASRSGWSAAIARPKTNSMLRRRSRGVAQYSQHMLGKAVDFYIPGVPLEEMRAAGLRAQRGGVGYLSLDSASSISTPAACGTGRACRKPSSPRCCARASSPALRLGRRLAPAA